MRGNQIKKLGNYHFVGKTLGKGHFGFVELAVHTLTNIKVAVKITEIQGDKAAIIRRNCQREVSTLNKLNHPCIVKIHETFKAKNTCCLVMEYVDGGDLLTFVRGKTEGKLIEEDARLYFEQIVSVLDYLHQRRIVHRDLKMENILLHGAERRLVKVIDFGFSNVFSKGEFLSTKCGSPEYAAPELFRRDCKYGTEVDVWSLGIILYGMLVGQLPFRNGNYGKLVSLISKGLTSVHQEKMKSLNSECVVLLSNILQPEPARRYTVQHIIAHSWLYKRRNKFAIVRPPDVDKVTKQKLIKATADVMELSRTQVGFAVELKQCDSIFAVYNILLQEELKQRYKRDSKTASSLVIRDHNNTTQLTGGSAEKRRRMNENESKWSRNILQKNRLRNTQAKRHSAMKTRTLNSEWKTLDGFSCVVGKGIGRPTTEIISTDTNEGEEIDDKLSQEVANKCSECIGGYSELTSENGEQQTNINNVNIAKTNINIAKTEFTEAESTANADMECQVGMASTSSETAEETTINLENKNSSEENESQVTSTRSDTFCCEDYSIENTTDGYFSDIIQDVPLDEALCEEYVRGPASPTEISCSTSGEFVGVIGGHASTFVNEITESPVATPSLEASSTSNILSLIDEQCNNGQVWMNTSNKDLSCTSEYSAVQTRMHNAGEDIATCVTPQAVDTKKKCPVQQTVAARGTRFKSAGRKGQSAFSTIPTKETVNPSKDLEEAIEERLKPCLKNSAASLRQRPHTASSKISEKSAQPESEERIVNDLPPRPKTARSQRRDCNSHVKRSNSSRQSKSIHAALKASRAARKNRPGPKVDSWIKPSDSSFKISGKKMNVEGSSNIEDNSRKVSQTQQRETVFVPIRLPSDSSATVSPAETKESSSINLVVGTGCFKKEKQVKSTWKDDQICAMDTESELDDSASGITDIVTTWLSRLEIDPKNEKNRSFQDEVNNCEKCRSESACDALSCKDKRAVIFSTSDVHKNDRSSRAYKSSKESVAAKWKAVEKFMCTGRKMNTWTREEIIQNSPVFQSTRIKNIPRRTSLGQVRIPSVAFSVRTQLVPPNSSMDTLQSADEVDAARSRERMLRKYQNSCGGVTDDLDEKSRTHKSPSMAAKNEYWSQVMSSELEKDNLSMGSKGWLEAHLTGVLDKAKVTRELCQMG